MVARSAGAGGAAALVAAYGLLLLALRAVPWHDAITLPLVLWLALRLLEPLGARGPARGLALFAMVAAVLSLELLHVWQVGYAGRNHVFAGVFALSDAGEYWWDAERVLHGAAMDGGGLRRPLSVAVLAGVLRLCGGDVRPALAAFAVAWAGGVALATSEVWRTHGRRAAAVTCILLVLFARRYVGFVQSEGLGGPLGLAAFALLWRAASRREAGDAAWAGSLVGALLLLALALLARPGPFTVLLGLLAWAWRAARPGARGGRVAAAGLLAIAAAVVVQVAVRRVTASGESFSDSPAILYGLLHGEEHTYVLRAQPWIAALPAAGQARAILGVLGREVAAQPWLVPVAMLRCLASWVVLPQGLFGFVWLDPDDRVLEDRAVVEQSMQQHGLLGPVVHWVHELGAYSLVNAIVMALAGAAFVVALGVAVVRGRKRRARDPHVRLALAALAGVLLSMPLLPPWITEGAQMHATVVAFFYALPAVVLLGRAEAGAAAALPSPAPLGAPALVAAVLALALLPAAWPDRAPAAAAACDPQGVLAELDRDALAVYGTDARGATLRLDDVRRNLALLAKRNAPFAAAVERTMAPSTALVPAYDACHDRLLYALDPEGRVAATRARWIRLAATPLDQAPLVLVMDAKDP